MKKNYWTLLLIAILINTLSISAQEYKSGDAEIDKVYILTEYLKQGIGKLLFQATLERLKELGYHKIILQSLSTNSKSNLFYEKMGANLVKILPVEFNETMHVYEFDLSI